MQRNRLPGLGVGIYEYESNDELADILERRIQEITKPGFGLDDIAIVSCRGTQSTALANVNQIGKHKLRKFTGEYNARNEQIYTEGEVTFDTIFRYKGQQAPCVILVDLDETIDRNDWHLGVLYCAMTRATMRLELVVKRDCPWLGIFKEAI